MSVLNDDPEINAVIEANRIETSLSLTYTVANFSYDEFKDILDVEVRLTRDAFNAEIPIEEAIERFKITAEFGMRRYTVEDVCTEAGDTEFAYGARIMMTFLNELERRYYQASHECSPVEALARPFSFTIEG